MNKGNVSKDIIDAIDIMYKQSSKEDSNDGETLINPVSALITPEWHYSHYENFRDNNF
ncbi:MAG: hypothetical protein P0116_15150 [Candidatus Nitrosocosmicus sp.]|nr:hypothetical protein [Candidatus Nitrosocosmicus sp.]